jgi:hypothetical protein
MSDASTSQLDSTKELAAQFNQANALVLEILELIYGPRPENQKTRDELMKLIDEVFISYLFAKRNVPVERVQKEFGPGPTRDALLTEVTAQTQPAELLTALTFAVAQVTNTYFTTIQDKITPEVKTKITTLLKEKVQ